MSGRILYEKDADLKIYPASMTKIMTSIIVFDLLKTGELSLDEKFLSCLEQGLPESSGMALGVDRLIMWLCGVENIREVLCFSQSEV